jgi:Na+-translocating ferredoxin:NAD+ oxidoreductase subunit E
MSEVKKIALLGIWKNNPALVQLLGLCPLLAVSNTTINGMGLALATLFVLILSNTLVSFAKQYIDDSIRIPLFVVLIASLVSAIELLMNAFTHELYLSLGIFIPLIVTNCAIIGRAEAYASKQPVYLALMDGLFQGLGFGLVLISLGLVREIIGMGTIFSGAHHLFGMLAIDWPITIYQSESPMLLAILPPGAFILLGFFIAVKNFVQNHQTKKRFEHQRIENQNQQVEVTNIQISPEINN